MQKEWLIVTILTFLTIMAWVVFDILHTRSQSDVSPQLQELTEPVNPDFNLKGLE